jgi:hypothetical protein
VLEHVPAVWLEEITEISNNNFILHFSHTDYKNGPYDNIYNIMDENGNMLWNANFSLLDYNEALYPVSQFEDISNGFNILCHNEDNDESYTIHLGINSSITETNVSSYSYANRQIIQTLKTDNFYYIFYFEDGDLIQAKLDSNYVPLTSSVISLNISIYSYDRTRVNLYENYFYYSDGYNQIACKISEAGELIWLTNWNYDRSIQRSHQGITEDGKLYILEIEDDQVQYVLINNDGEIDCIFPILQGEDLFNYFHVSYNGADKINVIVSDYEEDVNFLAQTVDLNGTMTYPIDGLTLNITPMFFDITLTSYSDKFSTFFLYTGDDRKTYISINTFNEFGTQIIPDDQTILESSFVSLSSMVCSQYLSDENCVLVAFISNRGHYGNGEVYIQKINQLGELQYEEEGRFITSYESQENIEKVLINNEGFVFIIYEDFDNVEYYKCDVFNQEGEFVRNFTLGSGILAYETYYHYADDGIIFSWALRNSCYKVHKFNQDEFLWDNPLTISVPTTNGMGCHITDNYIMYKYYGSPSYPKFLRRFDDDGNFYPGWIYNLNDIENLSWVSRAQQANDNFYFIGQTMQDEYKLLGIDSNQQMLFDDLNITMPYSGFGVDLLIDENIYLAYQDTIQQSVTVDRLDMSGQNVWSNDVLNWDPSYFYGISLHESSSNSISMITTHTENFRLASMDLDGNLVTPPDGNTIADGRGEKRILNTHEMDNGQFLITWYDYCVGNILDGDGIGYNAICGQLYDFSALPNDENTIASSHSYQLSNFPNPFNPETIISFSISNDSEIELSVYNIKGQKVKTLLKDNFEKGNHTIVWDGFDDSVKPVSSGVYLYELSVNGKIEVVKKCLLLK